LPWLEIVEIEDPDHLALHLQRHGDQGTNPLLQRQRVLEVRCPLGILDDKQLAAIEDLIGQAARLDGPAVMAGKILAQTGMGM
jgi:hypothetical protein